MQKRKPKKYFCETKVGGNGVYDPLTGKWTHQVPAHLVSYRVNDLSKYVLYLNKAFPDWRYTNVFDNLSADKKRLGSFTKKNAPKGRSLEET